MLEREIIDAEFEAVRPPRAAVRDRALLLKVRVAAMFEREVVRPPRAAIRDTVYAAIAGVILGVTYFVVSLL